MSRLPDVTVVGAGIYGVTAALELHRRGQRVVLLDPGPLPHPLAASTDISKVVRMEYGADDDYMQIVDTAIDGWHRWNEQFGTLYHETGVTMLTRGPMRAGGFEYESFQALLRNGHRPERLDGEDIRQRFPAWRADVFVDGFFHARGGFAESGRVVETLLEHARREGIEVLEQHTVESLRLEGDRVVGVRTRRGVELTAGHVLLCMGAWTPSLLPELAAVMRSTGHPVFHLEPAQPELFTPPSFVTFTADVGNTGWYGFPVHPTRGVIKIANHGVGVAVDPEHGERVVTPRDEAALRRFLADTFPALAAAPIVYTRRCLYNDTLDEHLWIDRHPSLSGLTVAAGGSGHAFKMAPILGEMIADAVLGEKNAWLPKFRWRELSSQTSGEEAARYHG